MITPRIVKVFALTWFSFTFMFVSIEPYVLGESPRALLGPALIGGLLAAVTTALYEAWKARREDRSAALTIEDPSDVEPQR